MVRVSCIILAVSLCWACGDDLESVSEVTKLRVLAIQSDPPEASAGQAVRLSALVADPDEDDRGIQVLWIAVPGLRDPTSELDVAGTQLYWIPEVQEISKESTDWRGDHAVVSYQIPAQRELLIGALPGEQRELFSLELVDRVTVFALVCAGSDPLAWDPAAPGSVETLDLGSLGDLCAEGDSVLVTKSFSIGSVEDAAGFNSNPAIVEVAVEGHALASIDAGTVGFYSCVGEDGCREEVPLALRLSDASFETFEKIEFEQVQTVDERLYISWFATGGKFEEDRTGFAEIGDESEVNWIPPRAGGAHTVFAVAHDVRGGVAFDVYRISD